MILSLFASVSYGQPVEDKGQKAFEKAIKSADHYFDQKEYRNAKEYYKQAVSIKPHESYPIDKIAEIDAILANSDQQEAIRNYYHKAIQKADELFASKNFREARNGYAEALSLKPDEKYPKEQIVQCEEYMRQGAKQDVEAQYQKLLKVADDKYHNCQLDKAKQLYERALQINPSDPLPAERIKNIDGINSSYVRLKQESENAYAKKNYLSALSKLRTAKTLHPCSTELDEQEKELQRLTANLNIEVVNEVEFSRYMDYTMADSVNSIEFHVQVANNSAEKIPDLGVSSRSYNLNFYINGEISNPVSLYNGMETINGERIIHPTKSAEYYVSWVLTPDSGIITSYGNEFTVQWEYCGFKSKVLTVNIKNQTAE